MSLGESVNKTLNVWQISLPSQNGESKYRGISDGPKLPGITGKESWPFPESWNILRYHLISLILDDLLIWVVADLWNCVSFWNLIIMVHPVILFSQLFSSIGPGDQCVSECHLMSLFMCVVIVFSLSFFRAYISAFCARIVFGQEWREEDYIGRLRNCVCVVLMAPWPDARRTGHSLSHYIATSAVYSTHFGEHSPTFTYFLVLLGWPMRNDRSNTHKWNMHTHTY